MLGGLSSRKKLQDVKISTVEAEIEKTGWRTHSFPDVLNLRSHHAALRVLVSHPVLSTAVDYTTATALQHITEKGRGEEAHRVSSQ